MRFPSRRGTIAAVLVAFAGGVLAFVVWPSPARTPVDPERTLTQAIAYMREHRLDEAEPLLDAYLRAYPHGVNGHLLVAQLALERAGRSDPPEAAQSRRALDHLRRIEVLSPPPALGAGVPLPSDAPRERALAALVCLYEGKAKSNLGQPAAAAAAWSAALRLNPEVAEAGWLLLDLYVHQGREAEARRLGMRLAEQERDVKKRLEWLLSLAWLDVGQVATRRVIRRFEPAVRVNPEDRYSMIALGLAYIRDQRRAEGLDILRRVVAKAPDSPDALQALLTGLWESQDTEAFVEAAERIPPAWAALPPFAEHLGRAAYARRDWPAAITALRRAWGAESHRVELAYLLARALRLGGEEAEATRIDARVTLLRQNRDGLLEMYKRLFDPSDAAKPDMSESLNFAGGASVAGQALVARHDPALLERFATLCENIGFPDQAHAWQSALAELYPSARQKDDLD